MASFSGIKNTLLASRRTKKLPPPMTQTQKTARPRSDMLQGLLSLFMDNGHVFFGSSAAAVTTMMRTVVCFPPEMVIVPSAVPM